MKRRDLFALSSTGFVAATLAGSRAAHAATSWNFYTYVPDMELAGAQGIQKISEDVAKATSGDLQIKVNLGGSLPISATNITQAVSNNIMQMGDDGFYQGNIPIGGILQLPMLMNTPEQLKLAMNIMHPYIERAYAKKGIILLGGYFYPLQTAWSSKKLECLADLKGQKMRVTSPEQAAFVQAFGGIPVTLGSSEVPSALDRGVIEGVFTASSGGGMVWKDLLKYNYRLGPNFFNSYIIANKKSFDRLSASEQDALKKAVARTTPWETSTLYKEETNLTAKLQKDGMIITPARASDIKIGQEKMAPYWKQWAKSHGSEAVEALEKLRAVI